MLRRWLISLVKTFMHTGSIASLCVVLFCASDCYAVDEIQSIYGVDEETEKAPQKAPAAPIVITVKPNASVVKERVYLGDVMTCGGDVEVCQSVVGIVLMPSPEPGRMATLTVHDLKTILASELPETAYTLVGQGIVRVTSEEQDVDAQTITDELQKRVAEINASLFQVEVRLGKVQLARKMKLRPGNFSIRFPQLSAENIRANDDWIQANLNGFVRIDVEIGNESEGKVQAFPVRTRFEIFRQYPVAARSLKKGDMLKKSDFNMEARKVSALSKSWVESPVHLEGHVLKSDVAVGEVPRLGQLGNVYLVQRGSEVALRIHSGGIVIQGKGKALMRGGMGEKIDVVYGTTKKKLSGKIVGESMVEVKL